MKLKVLTVSFLIVICAGALLGQGVRSEEEIPSLWQAYAGYFPIGAAVRYQSLRSHGELLEKHFNSITAENEMKFATLQPGEGTFAFFRADEIVDFAKKNNMLVRGHTLVWHRQYPGWLFRDGAGKASAELVLERLETHINTVLPRYKGDVYCWDVVNEAVSDSMSEYLRRDSPWYQATGEAYIAEAFRIAHKADPEAKLFYNDYGATRSDKMEKICVLLEDLLAEGVPVHGMGMQGHWDIFGPTVKQIETAIRRYAALGLEVQITELDISLYHWADKRKAITDPEELAERLAMQAEKYEEVFRVFREYRDVITGVTFWGVADDLPWTDQEPVRGRKDFPLLFAATEHRPKEAFWQIVNF
ncbi:MAG: endo-1,4-beta-xylanase [Firmicutes bacterium]|nr:endo-1,4-beta-xylanase [Bacillota bacterium]